jgi:HD superfamily phosphodiesterase
MSVRRHRYHRKHFDEDAFEVAKVTIREILAARQLDASFAARAGLLHDGAQGDEVAEVESRADIFHETFYPSWRRVLAPGKMPIGLG